MAYVASSFFENTGAFMIPGLALSKVYGNSILALLNSRLRIPGGRDEIDSDCVVDHLTILERRTELQGDVSEPSVSV
jgi:hypothetical protein